MELQEVAVYIILGLAILYLIKKFFLKPKQNKACGPDCGC